MEFFNNIKNSIYSPKFYQELFSKPFSYSFKYFVLFALLVSLVLTVILSFTAIPPLKEFVENIGPEIMQYYPQELQITVKSGLVSTNVQEPYFIRSPQEFNKDGIENLLVIDTKNDFSLEGFNSYKTAVLLTKNSIVYYKDSAINIQPIDTNINFYLDKNKISGFYEKIRPFLNFIYPAFILIVFAGYLFSFLFKMAYLLLGALVIEVAGKIKKVKIGYKKSYQFGFHLLTVVILIEMLADLFKVNLGIPFLFTILLFIFALLNIEKLNEPMAIDFKSQAGQAAKIMLALVIVCLVAIAIAYLVIRSAEKPAKTTLPPDTTTVPKAVYEATSSDIKVTFQESTNYGSILLGSQSENSKYQKNLITTEKFIMVTIGAQNKGKIDTPSGVWDLGNIIDAEGRNFIPNNYSANPWLPKPNGCEDVLKPEFTPTSCSKIYEVAKNSAGLKVEVLVAKKDASTGKYDSGKKDTILLDLIVNNK